MIDGMIKVLSWYFDIVDRGENKYRHHPLTKFNDAGFGVAIMVIGFIYSFLFFVLGCLTPKKSSPLP